MAKPFSPTCGPATNKDNIRYFLEHMNSEGLYGNEKDLYNRQFYGFEKTTLDERIEEALKNAPRIEHYIRKEIAEITSEPRPIPRWHLEKLGSSPI